MKRGSYDANRFTTVKAGEDEGRESKLLVEARRRRAGLEQVQVKEDDYYDPLKDQVQKQEEKREELIA